MTEKTLEAYNDVFSDIVNGLLFHGEPVISEHSLTDAQPFSMYKADGKLHEQERDVSKYWNVTSGEKVTVRIAFLGLENQTDYDSDMPLRVIGYDGAAYRAQLFQKNRYPVLTLVLYFGDGHWGKNRTLYDVLDVPEKLKPFINDYRINVYEIAHLTDSQISHFHSDFKIVADYFAHKRLDPDYRPSNPGTMKHVDEVLKMLTAITHDERFVETLQAKGGKPKNMEQVIDHFVAKGKEEGLKEGKLLTLFDLVKSNLITVEQGAAKASLSVEDFITKMEKA